MKEAALKETEAKQIVVATYTMAAEGLDIKTLTTLIMATPMTKIEQAVGRILREKHENPPIVVDIIDVHDNFQRQWQKRRTFFKSQNYKILQTTSKNYVPDTTKWKVVYEPTNQNKSKNSDNDFEENDSEDDSEENDSEVNGKGKGKVKGKCLLKMKKM